MQIQKGDIIARKDMLQGLQISPDTFKRREEEVLEFLKAYCAYHIDKLPSNKRTTAFFIDEIYEDEIPPFPKYQRKLSEEQRQKLLEDTLFPLIVKDELQTATNVVRQAFIGKSDEELKKLNYTFNTFCRYAQKEFKVWFGGNKPGDSGTKGYIGNRVWVTLECDEVHSRYVPMAQDQISDFYNWFDIDIEKSKTEILAILSSYSAKEITHTNLNEIVSTFIIGKYLDARTMYNQKYGGWPMLVSEKWLNQDIAKKYHAEGEYPPQRGLVAQPGAFSFD